MANSVAVETFQPERLPAGYDPGAAEPAPQHGKHSAYSSAAKAYRNEQLLNLTPVQVIEKLYSVAIQALRKNDAELAKRAVNELIAGLNFEYEQPAVGLYRLYEYCKDCIRKGNPAEAISVLEELRATWVQAFNL